MIFGEIIKCAFISDMTQISQTTPETLNMCTDADDALPPG